VDGTPFAVEVQTIDRGVVEQPRGQLEAREARHIQVDGLASTRADQATIATALMASMLVEPWCGPARDLPRERWTREAIGELGSPELVGHRVEQIAGQPLDRTPGVPRAREEMLGKLDASVRAPRHKPRHRRTAGDEVTPSEVLATGFVERRDRHPQTTIRSTPWRSIDTKKTLPR